VFGVFDRFLPSVLGVLQGITTIHVTINHVRRKGAEVSLKKELKIHGSEGLLGFL
jgi:hypothetical protein